MLRVAEVDERVEVGHRLEHDVAAASAVAAVGAAELDELLAPERDHAIAAVAGAEIDLGLIEEFHLWRPSWAGVGVGAFPAVGGSGAVIRPAVAVAAVWPA